MLRTHSAAVDDPKWVRARYLEAKWIIEDVRQAANVGEIELHPDVRDEIEDFYNATFLDSCTTLGPDCGCNNRA